jgi:hypothetical protein
MFANLLRDTGAFKPKPYLLEIRAKMTGFKLSGKEKIGEKECQVVEVFLGPPDGLHAAPCKVWFDTKTQLPVKRTWDLTNKGKVVLRVLETYDRWEINPKLNGDEFTTEK